MTRRIRLLILLLLAGLGTATAQKVTGTVFDEFEKPLPGVTVRVEGTKTGAMTDSNGRFTVTVKTSGGKLIFSYIGYKTQTLKAKDGMKVYLKPDAEMLEGVTVETGYGKIDRRLFTGAATKVTADQALIDGAADISKMLQGKVSGVQIQNVSSTFGAAPKIHIRGATSIYGDSRPLWVIDGVVLEEAVSISADDLASGNAATLLASAVSGLNANDIKSFEILKDASATALYGARAMNGVIVVTTKSGKQGSTTVNYSGEFTFRDRPRYRDYNVLTSEEQMDIFLEMYKKGWLNYRSTSTSSSGGEFMIMSDLINHWDPIKQEFGMPNTPEAKIDFLAKATERNTDWFKELFRPTIQQNHAVSFSGGNRSTTFYGSLSLLHDPGWTIADKVDRYTGNFNINHHFTKTLSAKVTLNGVYRDQNAPGSTTQWVDTSTGGTGRYFDINPFAYALRTTRTMRLYEDDGVTPFFYRQKYAPFNIVNELNENNLLLRQEDLRYQIQLRYRPIKQLDFNVLAMARYVRSERQTRVTERSNRAQAYRATQNAYIIEHNGYLYKDPDKDNAYPEVLLPEGGLFYKTENLLKSYYGRATANYNDTFNEKHILNILLGAEIRQSDRFTDWYNGYGLKYYDGLTVNTNYKMLKMLGEDNSHYFGQYGYYDRFVAFFSTASYSYEGKVTLNATGRIDGSNKMGRSPTARWLPTWNGSASWNIKETFLPESHKLSRLLLRGTFGLTASMGPANNSLPVFYSSRTSRGLASWDESKVYIDQPANKELTWEKQHETNIGLDLGLFNDRVYFSGDVYWRNSFDLIGDIVTSGIGGRETKPANYADMKSRGFEFSLSTVNVQSRDFSWQSYFTFSYNTNLITRLNNTPALYRRVSSSGASLEGYPVRALFSIPFAGLNSHGVPTFYHEREHKERTYYINFSQRKDLDFLKYEGPINPTITGGFSQSFKYKNVGVNFHFTYQAGNKIRLAHSFDTSYNDMNTMPREMLNRFAIAGDEKKTNIPTILDRRMVNNNSYFWNAYNAYNSCDIRVAKGDYVRLKDITVYWDIPHSWIEKSGFLSYAQVRCVASNVWLIYADKKLNGLDPEFSDSGGVAMPNPHQITMTLRVGF